MDTQSLVAIDDLNRDDILALLRALHTHTS